MSVSASDLVAYGAANNPENDSSSAGGAIDTTVRIVFDDSSLANTLNDKVQVVSDNAGDTSQTVTITGRKSDGTIISDAISLNGTTTVDGTKTFERILKIVVSGTHSGSISVKKYTGGTTIATIESGVLTIRRLFYGADADVSGGSDRVFYEKFFIKNNNGTNALLSAQVKETADPGSLVTFALANAVDDSESVANRLTAPASVSSFNDSDKNVPGTDLGTGVAIGIWIALSLTAGAAAQKNTFTMTVTGGTT